MVDIINYIIAGYFGLIIGNFATSFYFRVPRSVPLMGFNYENPIPPRCSTCNHCLKLKEYIPIFGYIFCKGRCNYCGAKIDFSYFIIEILSLFLSLFCYYSFNFLDWHIIFVLFGIVSLMMYLNLNSSHEVNVKFLIFNIFLAIIYKTLLNLTVYDWVFKIAICSIFYTLYMNMSYRNSLSSINLELLKIFLVAFFWFNLNLMIPYMLLMIAIYFMYVKFKMKFAKYLYSNSYVLIFFMTIINHLALLNKYSIQLRKLI
ncbi:prepilin peptidase [Candidatus Bandiella numerosa]|uniref:prepilin peptidase n=1 Tax=Candidatus Bandiella numerosa TaxID=2570586 RepID=UPI001F24E26C